MTVEINGEVLPEVKELYFRFSLCRQCIRAVSEVDKSDERRAPALAEYNRQLQVISDKIKELTGEYPPINVSLETAVLFGKSDKLG